MRILVQRQNTLKTEQAIPRPAHHEHLQRHLPRAIKNQSDRQTIQTNAEELEARSSTAVSKRFDFSLIPVHSPVVRAIRTIRGVDSDSGYVSRTAEEGVRTAGGRLPHVDAIQRSFGRHDVSSIVAHTDGAASRASQAIGAEAYASHGHVAFAGNPSLSTAAHEAAHFVQQRAGVHLKSGIGEVGDPYEQHADAVGEAVVRGKSAERLLDAYAGGFQAPHGNAIQRKDVNTHYGTFKSTKFNKLARGVDIVLEFHPDPAKIDAKKIGLTQAVKLTYADGTHTGIDPAKEGRRVLSGSGADYVLDRISTNNDPIYGSDSLAAGKGTDQTKQDNNSTADPTSVGTNATYQLGYAYKDGATQKVKEAALWDKPTAGDGNMFETTALGLEGTDRGKYFGSVKWGYKMTAAVVDAKDIEIGSMGVATQAYLAAADRWDNTKTRGTMEVTANPAKAKKVVDLSGVDVAKGTKGTQVGEAVSIGGGKMMVQIRTTAAENYYIFVTDLKDTQDGGETANVPVPLVFVNAATTGLFSDAKLTKKTKDLPVNTRLIHTPAGLVKAVSRVIPMIGPALSAGGIEMEIVDGPDIGQKGYVDPNMFKRET
jgi:hypothetical protein